MNTEQLLSPSLETKYDIPCMLKTLGLFEEYQMRAFPTQPPPAPTSSASSNEVNDNGMALAANTISGTVVSGTPGASIGRFTPANFLFSNCSAHITIPTHTNISSRHEIGTETRQSVHLGMDIPLGKNESTSEIAASVHASGDTTEASIFMSTTEATSNQNMASSETITKVPRRLVAPPPSTIEEYRTRFESMTDETIQAYDNVSKQLYKKIPAFKPSQRRKHLQVQRGVIQARGLKIQDKLCAYSVHEKGSRLLKEACNRIYTRLSELQDCLHYLHSHVINRPHNDDLDEKTHVKTLVSSWYEQLGKEYARYWKATDELIKPQPLLSQSDNSLEKLSTDAQASSHLKQCLCRMCPKGCHDSHTAYLSLEPNNVDVTPNDLAGERLSIGNEGAANIKWQCHMAFKSTVTKKDTLIWLKVVSKINISPPPPIMPSSARPPTDTTTESIEPPLNVKSTNAISDQPSRKRKASPMPSEPVAKAQKTGPWDSPRHTDPALHLTSSIELCPEFLTQHDMTKHAVMKMVDSGGVDHSMYYLAQEERSAYGLKNITLDELLANRQQPKYRPLMASRYSKLRLARLIAEAVLRFDLRDSDPAAVKNIFVHGLGVKGAGGIAYQSLFADDVNLPSLFLAITLKKQQEQASPSTSLLIKPDEGSGKDTARREQVLVDLGMILLRIGVDCDNQLDLRIDQVPVDLDERRRFISASAACIQLNSLYIEAVQNCALFLESDAVMTDEVFRDKFFCGIVQPLKLSEKAILQDREKQRNGSSH
ncbi:hypothetical protein F4801DRAFT_525208 [Xylaria longipes]|nr:hypothetical protein F4801DRAFT_525208 [Xylaria longipes]